MTDTIFALASGAVRSGVAVIRVSGPLALRSFAMLTGKYPPPPRTAVLAVLKDRHKPLDRALVLRFESPASFTGEDVVEYHVHGGRAVIDGVFAVLGRVSGFRMAEPGEFTRRAFENGKLDLTKAEAIADLIAAETEAQRLQAFSQLEGGLSKIYGDWAEKLTTILAHQEAEIEFPDEGMPEGIAQSLKPVIATLHSDIEAHLNDARRGERLRNGLRIAIVGAPNAGKSSLLNALARREAAIVSDEAGTTRDVIEVNLDLGGYPVIIADTAGLRDTRDKIEAEGVRRARDAAKHADVRIALFDATVARDAETVKLTDNNTIIVLTKADLLKKPVGSDAFLISVMTGVGMEDFLAMLTEKIAALFKNDGAPAPTRQRHRAHLEQAKSCLARSLDARLPELAAEDLRLALRALGSITGRVHVEEVLDAVFRDFCIGK